MSLGNRPGNPFRPWLPHEKIIYNSNSPSSFTPESVRENVRTKLRMQDWKGAREGFAALIKMRAATREDYSFALHVANALLGDERALAILSSLSRPRVAVTRTSVHRGVPESGNMEQTRIQPHVHTHLNREVFFDIQSVRKCAYMKLRSGDFNGAGLELAGLIEKGLASLADYTCALNIANARLGDPCAIAALKAHRSSRPIIERTPFGRELQRNRNVQRGQPSWQRSSPLNRAQNKSTFGGETTKGKRFPGP